jgi:hypothetical protein
MSERALICVVILFCLKVASVNAQVPTLDPSQTVNPATGEMGFSLPLGVVKGLGNHDFPINLGYSAGIQYHQKASSVGLGFSYGPGGITRKIVGIADDNEIGYYRERAPGTTCDVSIWNRIWGVIWATIMFAVTVIISVATMGSATPFSTAMMGLSLFLTAKDTFIQIDNCVNYNPADYIAGGYHDPNYTWSASSRGFLKGDKSDLPDIYFVNTPYISGQLVWLEEENNNGHFVMSQYNGSVEENYNNVYIEYVDNADIFVIHLADGTRLFFEQTQKQKIVSKLYGQVNTGSEDCYYVKETEQLEAVPINWLLTKVLFADYIDADGDDSEDPLSSTVPNKGNWIVFKYDEQQKSARPLPSAVRVTSVGDFAYYGSTLVSYPGDLLDDVHLQWIKTPLQKAEFCYVDNRKDDLYFDSENMEWWNADDTYLRNKAPAGNLCYSKKAGNAEPVNRKLLDEIKIYNSATDNAEVIRKIKFETDYSLRPGSYHSYTKSPDMQFSALTGNEQAGTLTLKRIFISDADGKTYPPINFRYGIDNPPQDFTPIHVFGPDAVGANLDPSDSWGYCKRDGWYPYGYHERNDWADCGAEAWSLDKVEFPNGLGIQWIYEAQRYDRANNEPLSGTNIRYGGGCRVKKISVKDNLNAVKTKHYFYTDLPASQNPSEQFTAAFPQEAESISCGHATAEPYIHGDLPDANDYRAEKCRGGIYSPAKVMYEKVRVVDNFNEEAKIAPQGYTLYEFITPADPGCANGGRYGEINNSWHRGLTKSVSVFNASNKLVRKTENTYEYMEHPYHPAYLKSDDWMFRDVDDELEKNIQYYYRLTNPIGWVRLKEKYETVNGVTTVKEYSYTNSHNSKTKSCRYIDAFKNYDTEINTPDIPDEYTSGNCAMIKHLDDPNKIDLVMIGHTPNGDTPFDENTHILYAKDIDFTKDQTGITWHVNKRVYDPGYQNIANRDHFYFGGGTFCDVNNNGTLDIITTSVDKYGGYLCVTWDIDLDDNATVTQYYTEPMSLYADFEYNDLGYGFSAPCIGNITSNNSSDDLVMCSYVNGANGVKKFKIYVGRDIQSGGAITEYLASDVMYDVSVPFYEQTFSRRSDWQKKCSFTANIIAYTGSRINDLLLTAPEPGSNRIRALLLEDIRIESNKVVFGNKREFTKGVNYAGFELKNFGIATPSANVDDLVQDPYYIFMFKEEPEHIKLRMVKDVDFTRTFYPGGMPELVILKANNEKKLVTENYAAFTKYTELISKNIFAPSCQSILYDRLNSSDRPVGASTVVWKNIGSETQVRMQPVANYVWKSPMANGVATETIPSFDFTNTSSNDPAKWVLKDSVSKTGQYNQVVETAKLSSKGNGNKLYTSVIYGHNGKFPVATVANSKADECGVLTCDYDDESSDVLNGYFDRANGWHHMDGFSGDGGICTVSDAQPHFGKKSLHLRNCRGAVKTTTVSSNKSRYQVSAWVYPLNTNQITFASQLAVDGAALPVTYYYRYNMAKGLTANIWQQIKFVIDISKPTSGSAPAGIDGENGDFLYSWIGNPRGEPVSDFYMDDFRIHPVKSQVATTYYDTKLWVPMVTVDANANPGPKTVYDGAGRPMRVVKFDKRNPADTNVLTSQTYHLHDELLENEELRFLAPASDRRYKANTIVDIEFVAKQAGSVILSFQNVDGTANLPITTISAVAGYNICKWNVPETARGAKVICAEKNSIVYKSDVMNTNRLPTIPTVVSPANNGYVWHRNVSFAWGEGNDPDGDDVKFIFWNDMTNEEVVTTGRTFTVDIWGDCEAFPEDNNEWNVRVTDGFETVTSPIWKFATLSNKGDDTYLFPPCNASGILPGAPTNIQLAWSGYRKFTNGCATEYELSWRRGTDAYTVITGLNRPEYILNITTSGTYSWKVRARIDSGQWYPFDGECTFEIP